MSRIERGKANPLLDAVETIGEGLRVPVKQLFEVLIAGCITAGNDPIP